MSKIKRGIDQEVLSEIIESVQKIKYGEVVIKIHDGKTVQIEKREKKRFDFERGDRINGARDLH